MSYREHALAYPPTTVLRHVVVLRPSHVLQGACPCLHPNHSLKTCGGPEAFTYLTGSMPLPTLTTVLRHVVVLRPSHILQGACPCLP